MDENTDRTAERRLCIPYPKLDDAEPFSGNISSTI